MNIFEGVIKIKSLLRYPGSKWRIASWILSYFPEHRSYLEPFVGSGAVFFSKQRSDIETINDLDGDVVNLFYWVKHDPEKLAHEVYYTPYARQIYDNAYLPDAKESSLNKAVKFLIRLNMGYGYRTTGANVGSGTCPDCETFLHIIFNPEREEMDLERFEDYQEK